MASLRNVYIAFSFIALGGFLFGYIIGISSNVVTKGQLICPDDWHGPVGTWTSWGYDQCYQLGVWGQGILTSLNLIGAMVSSLLCFQFADALGRKREVQIGALLYFIGSLVAAASPVRWGIYVGLTTYGLGIGFAMHAAPIYIAEMAPASIRGMLISGKEAIIVLGMFLGYSMGAIFSNVDQTGWRYMVGTAALIACVMGAGASSISNSPRWLVLQAVRRGGQHGPHSTLLDEARASLQFFRCVSIPEEVEEEVQSILNDAEAAVAQQTGGNLCETFRYPKPLCIGCGLVFLQQVTGQPSVLYFATNIFKDAGLGAIAAWSSVAVGFVKLLATLFTARSVDKFGRRQLLFWGIALMCLALVLMSVAFIFQECTTGGDLAHCKEAEKACSVLGHWPL